jgi:hypothetical protein
MLGYEHRMDMPHGGLFAIIGDEGRCQPMGNELLGMAANGVNPMLRDIRPVLRIQLKAMPEVRLIQALEQLLRRRWQRPRRRQGRPLPEKRSISDIFKDLSFISANIRIIFQKTSLCREKKKEREDNHTPCHHLLIDFPLDMADGFHRYKIAHNHRNSDGQAVIDYRQCDKIQFPIDQ